MTDTSNTEQFKKDVEAYPKKRQTLNPNKTCKFIDDITQKLQNNVIGQDEPIKAIVDGLSRVVSGVKNPEKPILTMLLLGSTGVGKTETVKVMAEAFFGSRSSFTRINCEELSESHTISKLLGSPPGYIGGEIQPLLAQNFIDDPCQEAWDEKKGIFSGDLSIPLKFINPAKDEHLSIILFDEIEKAHQKVWTSLLAILDDGHLTLSNTNEVNLRNSIIIMTTNVGSRELDQTLSKASLGFQIEDAKQQNTEVKHEAITAVKEYFPPEFCNRFDSIIAFNLLTEKDLRKILTLHLDKFQQQIIHTSTPIKLSYKKKFLDLVIKEGTSVQHGARHLSRAIQNLVITPISKMIASEQLIGGDNVIISTNKDKPKFIREERTDKQIENWIKKKGKKKKS